VTRILIPPPRVPLVDLRSGQMSTAWFAFFAQFLQNIDTDTTDIDADLTALTARVTTAETDVTALEAADAGLFVDDAFPSGDSSLLTAIAVRLAALELMVDLMVDRGAEIEALRKRVRDLETDQATR
jgi:hypothetical protein